MVNQPIEVPKRDLVRAYAPWIFQSVGGLLVLKPYTFLPRDVVGDFSVEDIERVRYLAQKLYFEGEIGQERGAGFSILDRRSLKVAVWDEEEIRLRNFDLDYFSNSLVQADDGLSLQGEEIKIYAHENLAWKKYLESLRSQRDLEDYLIDTYVK